jgi:putative component of membrane protein insertase Oxa1/YidC/SpoIIIJ protein YidD
LACSLSAEPVDFRLARDLFEERDWAGCVTECRRVEAAEPGHAEAARLRLAAEKAQRGDIRPKSVWGRAGEWPVRGMVAFYRVAVAPAIGSRCVLEPSCSRYSLEAARKNGWLGLPMTGDRLIREPSVVLEGARPVTDAQGKIRFADPVEDHMGWNGGRKGT